MKKINKTTRVHEAIQSEVTLGNWQTGMRIPADEELCEKYNVGRNTLREAISSLVRSGVLYRKQGAGTFIGSLPVPQPSEGYQNNVIHLFHKTPHEKLSNDFFQQAIVNELSQKLSDQNKSLHLTLLPKTVTLLNYFNGDREIDDYKNGVILIGLEPEKEIFEKFKNRNIPLVSLGECYTNKLVPSVGTDDYQIVSIATKHLIEHGHQKIALISGPSKLQQNDPVLIPFTKSLEEVGLPFDPSIVAAAEASDFVSGINAMKRLLDTQADFSAAMIFGDRATFGALETLRYRDIGIPKDLAIIALDEYPWMQEILPFKLTGLRQDTGRLAETLLALIVDCKRNPVETEGKHILIPPLFILGRSCGCVPV